MKWLSKEVTGWRQETNGWTNPETQEYFPPTFAWFSKIIGRRSKDNLDFYLNVRISGKENEPLDRKVAEVALEISMIQFEEFADCSCTLPQPCKKHKRLK